MESLLQQLPFLRLRTKTVPGILPVQRCCSVSRNPSASEEEEEGQENAEVKQVDKNEEPKKVYDEVKEESEDE